MRKPDLTGEELLEEYENGRRDFGGLALDGIFLPDVMLKDVSFDHSTLAGADFSRARLSMARFRQADLTRADFHDAHLLSCDLQGARLDGANFRDASLWNVSLEFAKCIGTEMSGANLGGATLLATDLAEACLDDAVLVGTCLVEVDVGPLCDAAYIRHSGHTYLDTLTVMKSYKHPRLKSFMVDCGIPELFAEYMIDCAKALGDDLLHELMQSTFISYGGPDEAFARRLYDALKAHGVVTFFFPETARVGERIGDEVFNALQRHDRMILVCSRDSLDRPGVLNEVQETLDREARDGGATYLIPVMRDNYLLTGWREAQPVLSERVARRVAADFSDPAKFDSALGRLLAALKKKTPGL